MNRYVIMLLPFVATVKVRHRTIAVSGGKRYSYFSYLSFLNFFSFFGFHFTFLPLPDYIV